MPTGQKGNEAPSADLLGLKALRFSRQALKQEHPDENSFDDVVVNTFLVIFQSKMAADGSELFKRVSQQLSK